MSTKNILVTITGPSLTGKSELAKLLKSHDFELLISNTTRPARKWEVNGVDYNFVDQEVFENLLNKNLMIEHTLVNGNYYGTSRPVLDSILNKGQNGICVLDPDGAQKISKYCSDNSIALHQIFVDNPQELLIRRFLQRYKQDDKADDVTYSRRLISMTTTERTDWVEKAHNGSHKYDQIFESFNNENQQEVVQEVLKSIQARFNNKNNKLKF